MAILNFTQDEIAFFREVYRTNRSAITSATHRGLRDHSFEEEYKGDATYLAYPQDAAGIPAMTFPSGTSNDPPTPGSGICDIYHITWTGTEFVVTAIPGLTKRVYNYTDTVIPQKHILITQDRSGKWLPVMGGSGAASDCCCACTCIDEGDITVGGVETTSRWAVRLAEVREVQANGSLVLPAGDYYMDWDAGNSYWIEDVSAVMTAQYTSGADATGATTMTGTLIMRKNDGGYTTLKLTFTGTVPAE